MKFARRGIGYFVDVSSFLRGRSGSVAMIAALVLPALCLTTFGAIELAEVARARSQLQSFVDTAAMSGARELQVDQSSATTERARTTADTLAEALRDRWTIETTASADPKSVSMTLTQNAVRPSFFGSILPPGGFRISVTAKASANSRVPLCVLGAQGSAQQVVALQGNAALTAANCLVQSNSDLVASGSARVQAGMVRSVGTSSGNVSPQALTDAPAVPDPFASLPISVPSGCTDTILTILGGTQTLNPGVHCGGLSLGGTSTLILNPGEHYFVGGSLSLLGNSTITGSDVVVIFKGQLAASFGGSVALSLEGRKSGPYAGFVLMTDRSFTGEFDISTKNAKKLLGTIYMPNATLSVSGNNNKVADQSPWTVVVAKQIAVKGSANLVINANYMGATVPVPTGVGPSGVHLNN